MPIAANGALAVAKYADGARVAITVVRMSAGRVAEITNFVNPTLFDRFGLP